MKKLLALLLFVVLIFAIGCAKSDQEEGHEVTEEGLDTAEASESDSTDDQATDSETSTDDSEDSDTQEAEETQSSDDADDSQEEQVENTDNSQEAEFNPDFEENPNEDGSKITDSQYVKSTGCQDSDEGRDYFTKGEVVLRTGYRQWDACNPLKSTNKLNEQYCDEDGNHRTEVHVCEFGCNDAVCLSAPAEESTQE